MNRARMHALLLYVPLMALLRTHIHTLTHTRAHTNIFYIHTLPHTTPQMSVQLHTLVHSGQKFIYHTRFAYIRLCVFGKLVPISSTQYIHVNTVQRCFSCYFLVYVCTRVICRWFTFQFYIQDQISSITYTMLRNISRLRGTFGRFLNSSILSNTSFDGSHNSLDAIYTQKGMSRTSRP